MKLLLLQLLLLFVVTTHAQVDLTAKIQPKNDGFQGLVDADQVDTVTTTFDNNLSAADDDLQKALETLDDLVVGGGSGTMTTVKEAGVQLGGADIVTIDFDGDDFDLTESPDTEVNIVINDAGVDHDATTNFVANEHVDHTSVTLTAGTGLTGGGDISANRSFNVSGLTVTEFSSANISQWTNDSGYLTAISSENLSDLSDVTITTIAPSEIIIWSGSAWINNTLAEAGISATGHTHTASDITDFDTEVSNNSSVTANTAKVTNATHTGDVTGSTALSLDKVAITGQTLATVGTGDSFIYTDVDDSDNLKKDTIQGIVNLVGSSLDHGSILGLSDDDHSQYSLISSQFGVPSSTPSRVGEINIDKTSDRVYISTDTSSSADWDITLTDGPSEIQSFGSKVSMANADIIMIEDSADSFNKKQVNFQNFIGNIDITDIGSTSTDFNSNYAWLPGRSGGQSLIGGTDSGDDLVLYSNNHPTKGSVFIGDDPVYVEFDETAQDMEIDGSIFIDGRTDEVQLTVQGHSTQTSNILEVETSAAATVFTVDGDGDVNIKGDVKLNGDSGTSGQVLTSAGSGVDPTWETPSGGGGAITGEVRFFAGSSLPTDWLWGDGSVVSRTTYAALFAVIGTTYGAGDGSTTFGLPDCRGRVLAGMDNMNNSVGTGGGDASRLTSGSAGAVDGDTLGASGGVEEHQLASDELATHTHNTTDRYDTPSRNMADTGSGQTVRKVGIVNLARTTTETQTRDNPHTNTQPTLVLNCMIKD